jgi:hypothetical protein
MRLPTKILYPLLNRITEDTLLHFESPPEISQGDEGDQGDLRIAKESAGISRAEPVPG